MPDTMMMTDRRFSIGRVLSQTFGVLFRNAWPILIVGLIGYGVAALIKIYLSPELLKLVPTKPTYLLTARTSVAMIIDLPFLAFVNGSLAFLAFERLSGNTVGIGEVLRAGALAVVPLTLLYFLVGLASGLAAMLLLVPGIVVYLRWSLASAVFVNESPGFWRSFSRSAELAKGHKWRLLGLVLIAGLTGAALAGVPALVVYLAPGLSPADRVVVTGTASTIMGAIVGMFGAVLHGVTYAEIRRVKEGGLSSQLAAWFN